MDKQIYRKKKNTTIENHQTAAWAEIVDVLPESKVTIPSVDNVELAKEWVEENQK
ncbi:hypothetical protein Curi_c21320 [Gottschalkia acidurici 9a]|uniref:DUF3787 domain-containing protein n=1 Tax=Gottschalkia acidurici (strain ATCC 7906 / DSM 604 / BCRC 14475 / CIP 104303 / KCTC 5404 / NCIMB 10678 / 9a) TaxID=1128398 RepID=K0B3C9_GOTA9|nr:DUF3787 domain-containing protein [Gottschalkia acidurici]AFS79136.1 hypothetical protein Curi_c21320 [Gottschalkia acidurici 9a]